MSLIQLLTEDHAQLRLELNEIKKTISDGFPDQAIHAFIEHFSAHEKKEKSILSMALKIGGDSGRELSIYYKDIHSGEGPLIKQLIYAIRSGERMPLQLAFLNLKTFLEAHFEYEENTLFPMAQTLEQPDSGIPGN